jgi:hypothetical protein
MTADVVIEPPDADLDGHALTTFEGRPVVQSAIEIPGAGGGLRDALSVEPREWHKGQRVVVVLDTTVDKIRFDSLKEQGEDLGEDRRVHVLSVDQATIVSPELVEAHLSAQAAKIAQAKAAAKELDGQTSLDEVAGPSPVDVEAAGPSARAEPVADTSTPFLDYEQLTGAEVIERIKVADRDMVEAIHRYEVGPEGLDGRAMVVDACNRRLRQLERKAER